MAFGDERKPADPPPKGLKRKPGNTSGLMRGHEGMLEATARKEAAKAALIESLKDPEGLKNLLREIAADDKQTASYRVSAVNALAGMEEDAKKGGVCWRCGKDTADVPKSVQEWIDAVPLDEQAS